MKPPQLASTLRDISETALEAGVPGGFRRLRWDEPVMSGDYVINEPRGFELWEGLSGFRADMFVKPIYRRQKPRANGRVENK